MKERERERKREKEKIDYIYRYLRASSLLLKRKIRERLFI
jgi:hypothetical protein